MSPTRLYFHTLLFLAVFFSKPLLAENLKVAVGLALPPYVLADDNTGIELDIVREALALKGHTITPVYLPFARVALSLQDKSADAALTVNENSGLPDVHFSNVHVTYQNVAVSLSKQKLQINTVKDLTPLSVIAFQDATKYLGSDFATMALQNKRYSERAKQSQQITQLFAGRVDTVVMDINIFKYFRKNEKKVDTSAPTTVHEIFPASLYKVGFLDKAIRDEFNQALEELRQSGKYDAIIKKYI
ncbi:MAG: transporter substrate-binding domain-containing protein [Pseudomonadales bacterium]|nr:transporter substrate-binding domain-containing protein [Pseudomonadales bacterium]